MERAVVAIVLATVAIHCATANTCDPSAARSDCGKQWHRYYRLVSVAVVAEPTATVQMIYTCECPAQVMSVSTSLSARERDAAGRLQT